MHAWQVHVYDTSGQWMPIVRFFAFGSSPACGGGARGWDAYATTAGTKMWGVITDGSDQLQAFLVLVGLTWCYTAGTCRKMIRLIQVKSLLEVLQAILAQGCKKIGLVVL